MPRARDLLGPGGPFAGALSAYEDRPGQLDMADAVERALEFDRVVVCEAGTGTGKTLAYLVPAILSGRKIVISTATRALQDQIFDSDLPLVARALGVDPRATRVKGLGNYLCRRRFDELRHGADGLLAGRGRAIRILESWLERTESGDVAEIEELSESDPAWADVASSSETRVGSGCAHYERCFVTRMKRAAEEARLLVVNHALFFADLAVRGPHGGVLPPYDAVVFDEAHQLEDVATQFFGVRVSSGRVETLARDAERAFVRAVAGSHDGEERARRLAGSARDATHALFGALAQRFGASEGRAPLPDGAWSGAVLDAYHRLDTALEGLYEHARAATGSDAVDLVARRSQALRDDLAALVEGSDDQVGWVEARSRAVSVGASPVDLAERFRREVWARVPAAVLTSATLTAHDGFAYVRGRLGIAGDEYPVDELAVPSPFDFAERALLYLPRDLPEPADPAFREQAAQRIAELVEATAGGAFVLCTSTRAMQELHADLARRKLPGALLVQGSAPKGALVARFREAESAVLVATMSFWEGVDVPGRALRLVIIDKLPFAPPTDPLLVARSRALEAEGKSAFAHHALPSAAILLKQGFGRLLRTQTDAGIVAILDRRLSTKPYGRRLLAALPNAARTDDMDVVRAFGRSL